MSVIDNAKKHFDSLETKIIEVPEWGEDEDSPLKIYCRPITLSETSKFMKLAKDDEVQLLAYVLIYKALDEAGEKLFTIADKKKKGGAITFHYDNLAQLEFLIKSIKNNY